MKRRASKGNRLLAGLLSILMVLSLFSGSRFTVLAEEPAGSSATVYVSVSKDGQLVAGKGGKSVAEIPVTLTGKESYTLDDALKAVHEQCYEGGAQAGYESYTHETYGLSLKKLWGDESGNFGYQVNWGTASVLGLGHAIQDGDYIDAYINQSTYPDNEAYAVFNKSTYKAVKDAKMGLQLTQAGYDEEWNTVFSYCQGAAITVDGRPVEAVTDEKGYAEFTISEPGIHIVSAVKTKEVNGANVTAITAPVCVVTVTEAPRLASLEVPKGNGDENGRYELEPAFDPNMTEYNIRIPDYVSSVKPVAQLAEGTEGKSIGWYGYNSMFGGMGWSSSNSINVSGGYFGAVIYDRTNSMSNEDIRYTVTFQKYATLSELSVDGVGTQDFQKDVMEGYHYYVDAEKDGVDITAAPYRNNYTVAIGGQETVGGEAYHLAYNWDENGQMEVPVTVSKEGLETSVYQLLLEKKPLNGTPHIMVQPAKKTEYIVKDEARALKIAASANGELSYQWYRNDTDSNQGGAAIAGAVDASYTPSAETVGTVYYYCIVTNEITKDTAASNTACILVDPDPTPRAVLTNPGTDISGGKYEWDTGYVYNVGESAAPLTVMAAEGVAETEKSEWTYQWRRVSSPYNIRAWGSIQDVEDTTGTSFIPPTGLNRANDSGWYYACKVSRKFKGKTYEAWATTGKTYTEGEGEEAKTYDVAAAYVFVKTDKADTPVIKTQPEDAGYIIGDRITRLSVSASTQDGGTRTYQWYENSSRSNEGGTAIENATSSSYYPEGGTAAEAGVKYYYCVVTNSVQGHTAAVASNPVEITIKSVQELIGGKLKGSGAQEDPYLIEKPEDYQSVADLVKEGVSFKGLYLKQTEYITLPEGWKPIGDTKTKKAFSGKLDGNNMLITVPEGGLPLLGYVVDAQVTDLSIYGEKIAGYGLVNNLEGTGLSGNAVTLENVTLKSGSSTLKSGLIGTYLTTNAFAGCAAGFTVTIKNCTIEKNVVIGYDKDQDMIGSFAGRINGTIENCKSFATVYGKNYVGGILGTKDNALGGCSVINCTFDGTVEAGGSQAGGIVGGGYSSQTAPNGGKITIVGCTSGASVIGSDKVGGIIGGDTYVLQLWGGHTLKDNSFTGRVKATGGTYVGGVIGYYASLNKYDGVTGNFYSSQCGADKGIGFVQYVDTSCASHETESGAAYINTAEGESGIGGITKTDHNRTDDPLGADAGKLCYNENTPVTATELLVEGDCKKEYAKGEELDLSGLTLTLVYNTGKTEAVDLKNVTVTGFDSQRVGQQEVILTYKGVSAALQVLVLNPKTEITVTVSVLGDSKHDCGKDGIFHTLAADNLETWAAAKEYIVKADATVWDVLRAVFEENQITAQNPTEGYIEALTRGGVTLGEADNYANSGWLFTVNGVYGDKAVNQQYLDDGDVVIFHYTDDYTKEDSASAVAAEVIAMIDALPAAEELSLEDAAAVAEAQKAFEALGAGDQAQIPSDRKEKLQACVRKMAELQKARQDFAEAYQKTAEHLSALADQYTIQVGSTGGEWLAIGLARAGKLTEAQAESYYVNVAAYVKEKVRDNGQLHRAKSTDNSRVVLGLTSIGKDVTDVSGHNLLVGLTDMSYVKRQGINGPIWALIAFDSHNYEIPAGGDVTRDGLIQEILKAQLKDGGWALSGDTADPDVTGMAVQALAPYYNSKEHVKTAVDRALGRLSGLQRADGGFAGIDGPSAESSAQIIIALTALGINPALDSRFIKNGYSALDALLGYFDGKGFKHTADGETDGMATEQGYNALVSYIRLLEGKTSLYDMNDVAITRDPGAGPGQPEDPGKPGDPGATGTPEKSEKPQVPRQPEKPKVKVTSPDTADGQDGGWIILMLGLASGMAALAAGKKFQRGPLLRKGKYGNILEKNGRILAKHGEVIDIK